MELSLPNLKYIESYLEMVDEFAAEGFLYGTDPLTIRKAPQVHLSTLEGFRLGVGIPNGWVPATEFWVLLDGVVAGRVGLRHVLSPALENLGGHIGYEIRKNFRGKGLGTFALRAALVEAKKLKLDRVLLTCRDDNGPSIRIIEKFGGVLQDKIPNPGRNVLTRRYWIKI